MTGRPVRPGSTEGDARADLGDWKRRVDRRARRSNLVVDSDLSTKLACYLSLLASWNRKINLTALDDRELAQRLAQVQSDA